MPDSRVSIFLQRICSAAMKTVEEGQETLRFLCNTGFRVGMLEVNNLKLFLPSCLFKKTAATCGAEDVVEWFEFLCSSSRALGICWLFAEPCELTLLGNMFCSEEGFGAKQAPRLGLHSCCL